MLKAEIGPISGISEERILRRPFEFLDGRISFGEHFRRARSDARDPHGVEKTCERSRLRFLDGFDEFSGALFAETLESPATSSFCRR